ncbi:PAS domain S-box protein, partial [Candidatus Bipolaricaulota bacterium]|nr:PAS domain S-box protein [Candidatus Bipolaricaulota bacterium]
HLEGKTDSYETEHRVRHKSGGWVWVLSRGRVIERNADGKPLRACGTHLDITERKRAEEDLLEQKALLSSIIESTNDAVFVKDVEGRYLLANSADARGIGRPLAEVLGAMDRDLFPAEIAAEIRRADEQIIESGAPLSYEQTLRMPGLETKIYQVNKYPHHDLDGTVIGVIGIVRDITKRKESERALRESEEKLRSIVEHSTNVFYSHTPDHIVTYVSPQTRSLLDCEPQECLREWTEFITDHPANEKGIELTRKAIDTGEPQPAYKLELVGKKGRKVWVEVHETPLVRDGKTVAIVGAMTDITLRKQVEEALRESEAKYRTFFDNSADAMLMIEDHLFVDCNKATLAMLGCDGRDEVIRKHPSELSPEFQPDGRRSVEKANEMMEIAAERGSHFFEWDHKRKDGSVFPVEVSLTAIREKNKTMLHTVWRDISDRKRAEEALRESEERLSQIAETIDDVFWIGDRESHKVLFASRAYEKIWGRSLQNLYADARNWADAIHPEDRERVWEYFVKLSEGNAFDEEYRIVRPDGSTRWIHDRGFPIRDASGLAYRLAGIAQDITDRKRAERALLNEKLLSEEYINSLPGLFYVVDGRRLVRWNREWERVTGYSAEELAAKHSLDFFEVEDRPYLEEQMLKVLREGTGELEAELVTKDGRRIPYYFSGSRKEFNGKPHLVGLAVDITQRKRAEQ